MTVRINSPPLLSFARLSSRLSITNYPSLLSLDAPLSLSCRTSQTDLLVILSLVLVHCCVNGKIYHEKGEIMGTFLVTVVWRINWLIVNLLQSGGSGGKAKKTTIN